MKPWCWAPLCWEAFSHWFNLLTSDCLLRFFVFHDSVSLGCLFLGIPCFFRFVQLTVPRSWTSLMILCVSAVSVTKHMHVYSNFIHNCQQLTEEIDICKYLDILNHMINNTFDQINL